MECKKTNAKFYCQNREENNFFKPEVGTIPGFSPHLSLCSPPSQVSNYQKWRRGSKYKAMREEIKMYGSFTPRSCSFLSDKTYCDFMSLEFLTLSVAQEVMEELLPLVYVR